MKITWIIENDDIQRIREFVNKHNNPFVEIRIMRNVKRQNIRIDKDSILKHMLMCLLTTQQRSGPNTPVGLFMQKTPFPLTIENIETNDDIENFIRITLQQNGLNRYINRIPKFCATNISYLQKTKWHLIEILKTKLVDGSTKDTEREVADYIDKTFSGFGPKQSRNFLQALGLTKYEIPVDSRITAWLNEFGFPVTLSSKALQDIGYYHFVSGGIQQLCEQAGIYPCVLDAAIFSSFDDGQWTKDNVVY